LIKARFLILHRYVYSESSFVVKALGEGIGVVSFLVKGARRKESPFRISMDPCSLCEIVYRPTTHGALQIPREAHLLQYHEQMRSHLDRLAQAQVMCEILLRLSQQEGQLQDDFALLHQGIAELDHPEISQMTSWALARFIHALGEQHGFALQLEECVGCGCSIQSDLADLWPAKGGGACSRCVGEFTPHHSSSFIQQLRLFLQGKSIPLQDPSSIELFFLDYLRIHFGISLEIHSYQWLCELRNRIP